MLTKNRYHRKVTGEEPSDGGETIAYEVCGDLGEIFLHHYYLESQWRVCKGCELKCPFAPDEVLNDGTLQLDI